MFTADGGVGEIKFKSTVNWKISVPDVSRQWCSVEPAKGSPGEVITVKVDVKPNEGYDERNSSIGIIGPVVTKRINIVQKQKDAILLSSSKVEIGIAGGVFDIGVQANVDYVCEVPEQFSGWLHQTRSRGLVDSAVTFRVDENETPDGREGYVDFVAGAKRERVRVYQKGGDLILLSESEKHISAEGVDFSVELRSNCDFTMTPPTASWLKVNESRTISTHTIYFTAEPYDSEESPRYAQVEFVGPGGSARDTLTIVQHEKSALILGADKIEVEPAGGAVRVEFATNSEVDAEIITAGVPWIKKTGSRAVEQKEMWFIAEPNPHNEPRTAVIRLSVKDASGLSADLALEQKGLCFEIVERPEVTEFMDAREHRLQLTARANAPFEVETTGNLTADGSDGDVYYFRLGANLDAGAGGGVVSQIKFKFGEFLLEQIGITQAPPQVEVVRSSITASSQGGVIDLPIETNTNPVCTLSGGGDWISLRFPDEGVPQAVMEPNAAESERSAIVCVEIPGSDERPTIRVIQQGSRPPVDKEISSNKAGGLLNALGDDALTLTSIRVGGQMNATDVSTLNDLAREGKLRSVDLSDAAIIADGSRYTGVSSTWQLQLREDNTIGEAMFYKSKLEFLTLPRNLKKIERRAFELSELNEIEVPESVVEIGKSAFRGCSKLTRAAVPGSVATLSDEIFCECMNLGGVALGSGIRRIGKLAFGHLQVYHNADGFLPNSTPALTSLTLPESVEAVDSAAFQGSGLTGIELPRGLKEMGPRALYMNFNLRRAVMPVAPADGRLPRQTFYYCHSLEELTLPEGLRVIGEAALARVAATELILPSTVTTIERYGLNMASCRKLRLPESLITLHEGALAQMPWLEVLDLPAGLTEIGPSAFYSTVYSLREIRCRMAIPPSLPSDAFGPELKRDIPLIVPSGARQAYAADAEWGRFTNIIESEE